MRSNPAGLCLCLLLLLTSGLVAGQPPSAGEDFADRAAGWDRELDDIARHLARPGLARSLITPLNARLRAVQAGVLAARDHVAAEAAAQQRLLDALGPAPDDETLEERHIAETRAAIRAEFARLDSQRRRSELTLTQIDLLFAALAEAEYQTLLGVLSERAPLPLAPATLRQAARELVLQWQELVLALRAGDGVSDRAGSGLALIAAVLGAGVLIVLALRRRLLARYGREPAAEVPRLGRRLLATVAMIGANVLLPGLVIGAFWATLESLPPLPGKLNLSLNIVLFALLDAVFVIGFAGAILAPTRPRWRISAFGDAAALSLYRAVRLYALLMLTVIVILGVLNPLETVDGRFSEEQFSAFFSIYSDLYAVLGFLALAVISGALLNVLRPRNWRFRTGRGFERPPAPLLRGALLLVRGALIAAVSLGAFGYLYAGIYLTERVSFTLALASLALLLRTLIAAGLRYLSAADTRFGRQLRRRLALDDGGAARLVFWLLLLLDVLLAVAVIAWLALHWGIPQAEFERLAGSLVRGVSVGDYSLSLFDVGITLAVFAVLLILVRLLREFLANRVLPQTRLDVGARDAIAAGIGYLGLVIAVLVAVSLLGLDLSQLALILGALSVGIGFGLQHVVSNFIAGLILLIQRPIKAGDWIVVGSGSGSYQGYVKHINVTATEIQTFDNASVLVPNSNLLSNEVLNWTHKSTLGRVIVTVRAAYGSDPERVRGVLLDTAMRHAQVLSRPEPEVLLQNFGPSALEFELRFYLREIDTLLQVASELRFAILAAFEDAGITIPFPQHDVRIRGAAPWPASPPPGR